jgi:hypothetical protein
MLYGLFQAKGNDGEFALEVWQVPTGMSLDNYAKKINAMPIAAFSSREEAASAKAKEEATEVDAWAAPTH